MEVKEIGILWEYVDQAMPRSINGLPIFMSMHMMSKADWKRALDAILAETERRKTIPI